MKGQKTRSSNLAEVSSTVTLEENDCLLWAKISIEMAMQAINSLVQKSFGAIYKFVK